MRHGCAAILVCWCAMAAARAEAVSQSTLERSIQELGDQSPEVRLRATVLLRNLPGETLEQVDAALKRTDVTSSVRAELERTRKLVKVRRAKLDRARGAVEQLGKLRMTSYEKVSAHDPKWDELARQAMRLTLAAHMSQPDERERVLAAFEKAIDAGCRDPMILFFKQPSKRTEIPPRSNGGNTWRRRHERFKAANTRVLPVLGMYMGAGSVGSGDRAVGPKSCRAIAADSV